jgi:diguanylate cyclase (GGDEF)-like protein/putative nucleotidyltransferase with HDIG domain
MYAGRARDPLVITVKELPLPAQRFVKSVVATAAALLALHLLNVSFSQPVLFLSLLGLSLAAGSLTVALPFTAGVTTMSVSYAVDFASMILIGPNATLYIAAAGAFSQCQLNKVPQKPLYETLLNIAMIVVAVQVAGSVFMLMQAPNSHGLTAVARPLVASALAYFSVYTFLVARAVALPARQSTLAIWKTDFLWTAPNYLVAAGGAGLTAWGLQVVGAWAVPLLLAPIYLTYRTYKVHVRRLEAERDGQDASDLHLATIEALAGAIDAKDQMGNSHILRVQFYARGLADAIGISGEEVQAIKTAALLHDIGKLAIPEHILSKPGPLTPEEFQKVRIHPKVGAEIIAGVPFPYPVASLILCHHERWDGNGYPNGLAGEAIPIGARILSVVDYYDAVTSVRPYHSALSREGAVDLLKHEAGRALDPTLVDVFVRKLPELVVGCEAAVAKRASPLEASASAASDPAAAAADRRATAFHNIGLAHREIYALYEIAQSMGTSLGVAGTMDLISSKLSKIIPWSGCALFLQQQDQDVLRCRYAAGVDASRLIDTRIRVGKGLSGWVARNRRILVNVSPRVEFEAAGVEPESRLHSAIVCPLYLGDTFIGSLALFHTEANRYNDDHRRLITSVADQAGAVIHNSIVFEQAQEDSLTDPLTSLPNRRSLFARVTHELARAQRLDTELTMIVLDIDEFKRINDTWGHHVGDEALREVANVLRGALRQYDMCVRFAGDEFVVVISDCGRESAESKRLELQEQINTIEIEVEVYSGKRIQLKASAGAAVFPHDGRSYEELLAQADRRMYQDKSVRRGSSGQTPQQDEWIEAAVVGSEALAGPYDPDGVQYD